jgi:hypothetical protein
MESCASRSAEASAGTSSIKPFGLRAREAPRPWAPNDDYVWGKPVRINEVAPGDVLQFRNWIVTTKTEIVVRFADGSGYRDTDEVVARRPHHTAIVKHIGGGGVLQVYEQHVKPLGNRVQLHDVPTKGSPAIARLTHTPLLK